MGCSLFHTRDTHDAGADSSVDGAPDTTVHDAGICAFTCEPPRETARLAGVRTIRALVDVAVSGREIGLLVRGDPSEAPENARPRYDLLAVDVDSGAVTRGEAADLAATGVFLVGGGLASVDGGWRAIVLRTTVGEPAQPQEVRVGSIEWDSSGRLLREDPDIGLLATGLAPCACTRRGAVIHESLVATVAILAGC
jgi:hypothetical protein